MEASWKDSIYRQREELARMLREPLELLSKRCAPLWGSREQLNNVLMDGFSGIPYCTYLYVVDVDGLQISDNIGVSGVVSGYYHRNRGDRP